MSGKDLSIEERRARLERRAEVIRSRLLRHVDALDERRHQVTEVATRAKDAVPLAIGVVALGGLLLGGSIALLGWGIRRRRKDLLATRISEALAPFRKEEKPSLGGDVLRRLLMTGATMVATELARRVTSVAVDGKLPNGDRVETHGQGGLFAQAKGLLGK